MLSKFYKVLAMCLCGLLMIAFVGCGNTTDEDEGEEKPSEKTESVFVDPNFETGFDIYGTGINGADRELQKSIKFGEEEPDWKIAQWYSQHFLDKGEVTLNDNLFSISDTSKSVVLDRNTGAITLSMNAGEEFESVQTSVGSFWPHLLLEQNIEPVKFSECETMEAHLSFQINRALDRASDFGEDKANLQAQFAWFVYVQNVNPDSAGLGEFLWFGFNLFDPTKLYAQQVSQQDFAGGNPGNYIYAMGAADCIGTERVKVGQKSEMTVDMFEAVQVGLDAAHAAGFMSNTTLQDCAITGMNIGFEIFDVWDLSVTLYDMGVTYTPKE